MKNIILISIILTLYLVLQTKVFTQDFSGGVDPKTFVPPNLA
jgi:hypothetical protein